MPRESFVSRSLGHLPGVLARRARFGSLLVLVTAAACATGAHPRAPGSFLVPDGDPDRVRRAALAALRDAGWHPDEVQREPGRTLIRSEWSWVGGRAADYMDCAAARDPGGAKRGRMQIEIVPVASGVEVIVSARWRARRPDRDGSDECTTSGVAEDELREVMLSILAERRRAP